MTNPALDPGRSAAVAASAGTGKTWLLAARITRLLLSGAAPGGILALTFTRKAAAEMQARVTHRLHALAFASDAEAARLLADIGLGAEPALLERARGLYEQLLFTPWPLRATTIHAFCQELVTRFALQTGTTPGFEVSEDEGALKDAAWQRLQRGLQRNPDSPSAQALTQLIAGGRGEAALRDVVTGFLDRRNDWRAFCGGSEDGVEQLRRKLQEALGVAADDHLLAAVDADALSARLHMLCGHLQAAEGSIDRLYHEQLLPVFELRGAARLQCLRTIFFTQENKPRKFRIAEGKRKKLGGGAAEHCARLYEEIVYELDQLQERLLRQNTLRDTLAAATLGSSALQAFERELIERAVLSFPELEWRAYRLLRQSGAASWVQYRLDARIEHLLVDEFQDTSDTQWQLLLPLLQEMAAGSGERRRSAFIVGDAKQSIYGFRRANPQLLQIAGDYVGNALGGVRSTLSDSWRSAPAVIGFVNALFSQEALRPRLPDFPLHGTRRETLWGRVELAPLVPATREDTAEIRFRNPLQTPRPDAENRRAHEEGGLIARRIRALCAERWPVAEHGSVRPIGYGDIMILLRKRTHQGALERALSEHGIPFIGSSRGTLLQTVEARDLLALLRFLASPVRDLDLAHALRSPLFDWTDTALIALARSARTSKSSWWRALQDGTEPGRERAQPLLSGWLQQARQLPAHDLIDRILCEANAVARYEAALPAAQAVRVRANLDAFTQLALSVDSGRYPSLSRFLRQLDSAAAPDEAPPPAADSGAAGAVRILTIHAAKGLEAPAVFLAQATSTANSRGAGWLVHWPMGAEQPLELLLAAKADQRDRYSAQLIQAEEARAEAEDLNLLYVACTRARQFLHISGFELARSSDWHALAQAAMAQLGSAAEQGLQSHAQGAAPQVSATAETSTAPAPAADERLRRPLPVAPVNRVSTPSALEAAADPQQARRGIALHYLLQQLSAGAADGKLCESLEARLGSNVAARDYNAWLAEARAVIASPPLRRFFDSAGYTRAWNEVPLHYPGVSGVIDRLVDDGETLWVLDYKSERGRSHAELAAQHRPQLMAYCEGVRRLWPQRSVRAGLVLTAEPRWLELTDP